MNRSALGGFIALAVLLFSVAATGGQAQEVILIEDDFTNPAGDMPNEVEDSSPIGGDRTTLDCNWQSNGCCHNVFDGVTNLEMPFDGNWSSYIDSRQCGAGEDIVAGVAYALTVVFTAGPNEGGNMTMGWAESGDWGQNSGGDTLRLAVIGPDGSLLVHPGPGANHDLTPVIDTGADVVRGVPQSVGILIGADGAVSVYYANGIEKNWNYSASAWTDVTPSGIPNMAEGSNMVGVNPADDNGNDDPFLVDYFAVVENPDMGPVPNEVMRWSLYD